MSGTTEVRYYVLPDPTKPYLLARVRWPDIFQAISAARPDWQDDPGLFDLPYSPSSTEVTLERANALAEEWGARLPSDENPRTSEPSLIRRMPADWSNLSPAEKRAWSLEFLESQPPAKLGEGRSVESRRVRASASRLAQWWRGVVTPWPGKPEISRPTSALDLPETSGEPVDLVSEPMPARVTNPPADNGAVDTGGLAAGAAAVVNVPDTDHDAVHR